MELQLIRKYRKTNYTIGKLLINNKYFSDTLEDTDRGLKDSMSLEEIKRIKVFGSTCIPYGTYKVTVTYSPKFKRNLPLINNVKGYDGIRIHSGNTNSDTSGCLLLGFNKIKGRIINSKETVDKFISIVQQAINKGEQITLNIVQ